MLFVVACRQGGGGGRELLDEKSKSPLFFEAIGGGGGWLVTNDIVHAFKQLCRQSQQRDMHQKQYGPHPTLVGR